ncbi:hypothetical protein MTR67_003636 [Solanum verrucosum]|uniref:SKP1 component dimerisation domain-containing protein n=1 Tax=Solanum verrucosum TaxID=315347 RepID=A0AAF0T9I3_SOLVR|nr:hypothetical protein MTR67_003636 [Solanum verrucosum]
MTRVIEYWKKHSEKGVRRLRSNNLDDNLLRDVMIQEVVDRIKGKTTEEMHEEFGIKND